jgi:hypothetical protein
MDVYSVATRGLGKCQDRSEFVGALLHYMLED